MNLQVDNLPLDVKNSSSIPFKNADCVLSRLPNDVTNYILFMSFDPYKPNSRVCRRFRQLFNKQIKTWRYFNITRNLNRIFKAFPNIKSLETCPRLFAAITNFLQRHRIEEITIRGELAIPALINSPTPPFEILSKLHSLKRVKIINAAQNQEGLFCTRLPPSVTALSLLSIGNPFSVPRCDNLQHLDVSDCPEIMQEGIPFAALRTLRWEDAPVTAPELPTPQFRYAFDEVYRLLGSDVQWTEKFIAQGGNVNILISYDAITPLFKACKLCELERVRTFITFGANVNVRDSNGSTPLHMAVLRKSDRIVECLINAGASVNASNGDWSTPLHLCTNPEIMQALLRAGADPNAKDIFGNASLHKALEYNNPKLLHLLIAGGAKVSATNREGKTALELARDPRYPQSFHQILLEAYLAQLLLAL